VRAPAAPPDFGPDELRALDELLSRLAEADEAERERLVPDPLARSAAWRAHQLVRARRFNPNPDPDASVF
jgi:hypothetical protein